MIKAVLIFITSVCIASVSQILLKKSANQEKKSILKEYLNKQVIIGYGLLFASTLLTMYAYKTLDLSLGVMIESISYIIITVLSYFILKEKITKRKIIGIVLIMLGIIVYSIF